MSQGKKIVNKIAMSQKSSKAKASLGGLQTTRATQYLQALMQ